MLRINQLKMDYKHSEDALIRKLAATLKVNPADIQSYEIVKRSVDARKRPEQIFFVYTIDVAVQNEKKLLARLKNKNITKAVREPYRFRVYGQEPMKHRPVIIGMGPAGLICGLMLARHGYQPILIERGSDVDTRTAKVEQFWREGTLDPNCNVQFGEGGAGTFSDGKLNTLVKDKDGRNRKVLEIFVAAGADPDILYVNKPHIGTDILRDVVKHIREEILALGGTVCFDTYMTDIRVENQTVQAVCVAGPEGSYEIETDQVVLAVGHSARETYRMLYEKHMDMQPKAFAMGVRMEHPQEMINLSQYGLPQDDILGAADYKLTHSCENGRSVYTFCMCPGGHVVNASSVPGMVTVNGMSYHGRSSANANSAVIVNVTPEDFGADDALAGVRFQERWEAACYQATGRQHGIPVQLFTDFEQKKTSNAFGEVHPVHKGMDYFADLHDCLPTFVTESIVEGVHAFGAKIKGYDRPDALMSGIEARTSSPLRMVRDEDFQSNIKGIYPCGEGAGYAGGITSAAMDGLKVAEAIAAVYAPINKK